MFFVFNNNVYLVQGNAKSCIYDFNTGNLYSINNQLTNELKKLEDGHINEDSILNMEFKQILEKFMSMGIVTLSDKALKHNIRDIGKETKIQFAWIEITDACNLRCAHCYNESDEKRNNYMTMENYEKTIDTLVHNGVKRIQIIGGEPFLYKSKLKLMLDYTVGKFEFIEIFTNGTLIDDLWLDYLKKMRIHIALSVYSYDKVMHDRVTGRLGSWDATNLTINKLRTHKIPYRVCNVLMKEIEIGKKNTNAYELSLDKDVVRMSGRANFNLLSRELIRKKLITKKTFKVPLKKEFCSRIISGHNCYNGRIYIAADMKVYPCVMERRLMHSILQEKNNLIINEDIRKLNKEKINSCNMCEYRYCCFDCRPNSLTNDIYEKPWYCTYNPKTGEWYDEEDFINNIYEIWG